MRKTKIETEKYYHILNRGANKSEIFLDEKDYFRFLSNLWEFNNELKKDQRKYIKESYLKTENTWLNQGNFPWFSQVLLSKHLFSNYPKLVEIVAYNLQPNHYHFILKQLIDNGIKKFMHKLGTGYTRYFNNKYNHSGVIFQGNFKSFDLNSENELVWKTTYVNCNYEIHKLGKAQDWQFSSYQDYLGLRNGDLCNKEIILKEIFNNNIEKYRKYCEYAIKEFQENKKWQKIAKELE